MRDPNEMAAADCEEEVIEVGNKLNAIQYRSTKGDELQDSTCSPRRPAREAIPTVRGRHRKAANTSSDPRTLIPQPSGRRGKCRSSRLNSMIYAQTA